MVKFIHKKHILQNKESGKIIIYYSLTDITLGVALLALVVFFINDYLSHQPGFYKGGSAFQNQNFTFPSKINIPVQYP